MLKKMVWIPKGTVRIENKRLLLGDFAASSFVYAVWSPIIALLLFPTTISLFAHFLSVQKDKDAAFVGISIDIFAELYFD